MPKKSQAHRGSIHAFEPVLSGVLLAAALTILVMLGLALLLRYQILPDSAIGLANQVVKIGCIFLAAFWATRRSSKRPWLRGMFAGIIYVVLGIAVFSVLAGEFDVGLGNLADAGIALALGAATGAIFGRKTK